MRTAILIKTDEEVKANAQQLARQLGITLSDVLNAALRNFIRTKEVYITDTFRMTPELEGLLEKIDEDIKAGKNLSPGFSSAKEMDEYLNAL